MRGRVFRSSNESKSRVKTHKILSLDGSLMLVATYLWAGAPRVTESGVSVTKAKQTVVQRTSTEIIYLLDHHREDTLRNQEWIETYHSQCNEW